MKIKQINKEVEYQAIINLQNDFFNQEKQLIGFDIPYINQSIESIMHDQLTYLGLYERNQLIGILAYLDHEIYKLGIKTEYTKQAYACKLLDVYFKSFEECEVSTPVSNIYALKLYQKCGFVITNKVLIEEKYYFYKLKRGKF